MYVYVYNALTNRFYKYSGITFPDAYIRKLNTTKPHLICASSLRKLDKNEVRMVIFGSDSDSNSSIVFLSQDFDDLKVE